MKIPDEDRLKELDEMNLLWLFRQGSVGNLLRGARVVARVVSTGAQRILDCVNAEDGPFNMCRSKDKAQPQEKPEKASPDKKAHAKKAAASETTEEAGT